MRDVSKETGIVKRKIALVQEIGYTSNQETILNVLKDWIDKSPDNESLKEIVAASIENSFYVNRLQKDSEAFGTILAEERKERNKVLLQLQEVQEELRVLKLTQKL